MDWSTILPFILTLGGLVLLVLSNNLIGGFNAMAEGTFDKEKSKKVSAIVTGAYGVYGYKFVQKCIEALQLKINVNPAESGEIDKLSSAQRGS